MKIVQIGVKVGKGKGVGFGNAGDTAIGSAFDFLFEREFQTNSVDFINCRKVFTEKDIDFINQHDVLFLSGGGLFLYDTFANDVSDWQWGISEELLDKITIPIVVYAVGYNKFRKQRNFNKTFDNTLNKLVEKSIFFSLRNSGSCRSIKQHIDKRFHEKVRLNFCPTMLLNNKFQYTSQKTTDVGFVFAGDRLENRHENLEHFIEQISIFVNYLKTIGRQTILINHQNDLWINKYIEFDKTIDLFGVPPSKIYQIYTSIDTIISDRGHAQMIPFSCGCKIISPISHDKLKWFLQDIDLEEFGVEENDKQLSQKLISKFEKLSNLEWSIIHQKRMKKIIETNSKNMIEIKKLLNLI